MDESPIVAEPKESPPPPSLLSEACSMPTCDGHFRQPRWPAAS